MHEKLCMDEFQTSLRDANWLAWEQGSDYSDCGYMSPSSLSDTSISRCESLAVNRL